MYLNFAPVWSRQLVSILTIAALLIFSVSALFAVPQVARADVSGTLIPSGNGDDTDWTGDVSDVSDAVGSESCGTDDGDGNVSTATTDDRDSFNVDLSSIPDGATITSVDVTAYYSDDTDTGGTDGTFRTFARLDGGSNTDAGSNVAASSSSCLSVTQTLDVEDTDKNSTTDLEIGVLKTSTDSSGVWVGAIRAVVTYSTTAAGSIPFSDSFSGADTNNVPNWTDGGGDDSGDSRVEDSTSRGGSTTADHVRVRDGGHVTRTISTVGYEDITLTYYWRGDSDAEPSDDFLVQWKKTTDGSFLTLNTHDLDSDVWSGQVSVLLPASADNTSIDIRFVGDSNSDSEEGRIDDVEVTGTVMNSEPVLGSIGSQSGNELTEITFDANATDADVGDILTFSLSPHLTTATIDSGTGVFSWTPVEGDNDPSGVYNFTVNVSDGTDTDSEIVTVTVNEVNVAPAAADYAEATHMNDDFTTTLQGSDSDLPANTLTYTITSGPTSGTLDTTTPAGNQVTYTPNADYVGSDSFTYQVSDGTLTDTGVVSITVSNSAPVIDDIADPSVAEGTLLSFTATASDTDVPADKLTFSLSGSVPSGASMTSGGVFSWTPTEAQGPGVYSFTIEVTDGAAVDSEFVVVAVTEVNTSPVAVDDSTSTVINTPISIPLATLLANDTDADVPANTLSVSILGPTAFGTAVINGSNVDFTPATNFTGSDSFSYFVYDGTATDEGMVTVSVNSTACSNESDDDEDGLFDFPSDPGCSSLSDTSETDEPVPAPDEDTTPPLGGGMPSLLGGGANPGINPGSVLGAFTENTDHGEVLGAAISAAELNGEVLGASTDNPLAASCTPEKRLITSNLGLGRANPVDQVKLLQIFLNQTLGLSIPNSGVFGPMTFEGVKTFQSQHAAEILAPWGITEPTGYVGITTRRMIDITVCGADYPIPTL